MESACSQGARDWFGKVCPAPIRPIYLSGGLRVFLHQISGKQISPRFWVDNVPAVSFISCFLLLISSLAIQVETCLSAITFSSPPPPLLPQSIIFLIHHLAITPVLLVLSLQMWQLISSGKYQLEQCRSNTTLLPPPSSPTFASLGLIGREQSPPKSIPTTRENSNTLTELKGPR